MTPIERRQLIEQWIAAGEGTASEEQLSELNAALAMSADARDCVLSVARQQGWLAWNAANVRLPAALATLSAQHGQSHAAARQVRGRRWTWAAVAASLVGVLMGLWWTNLDHSAKMAEEQTRPIQARMVSSTGCIWGPGNPAVSLKTRGAPGGDSLQLLEGIAEFHVDASDICVQMEGPSSLVLTGQNAASMNYGKVILKSARQSGAVYAVETSFGRVLLSPESEIGVITFGSKAEIHCFRGQAAIESPWLRSSETDVASVGLRAGEALQFTDVGGGTSKSNRTTAQKDRFTPQVSMNSDFLAVTPDYVRTIIAASPVAYWRFEESAAGLIRNEMGSAFQGRVKGEVGWAGPEGNRAVELGMNNRQGSILADQSWDSVLSGDFAIELWMKPSHQHLGSMVGFVGDFDPSLHRNRHGVLVEACGPSVPSWLRPKQLRFLHRSELTAEASDGVSCFSGVAYEARRWQHVVAVKEGGELRLYLDGRLVQTARDELPTPKGLHLVIGQLYTETVERFFIGQLDEVAIYGRALSSDEVAAHHQILRPVKKPVSKTAQTLEEHAVKSFALFSRLFSKQAGNHLLIQEVEHGLF